MDPPKDPGRVLEKQLLEREMGSKEHSTVMSNKMSSASRSNSSSSSKYDSRQRYFFLDKGILKYGKCRADIDKGKLHGCIDVGLSVMAIKQKAKCIDLDAEENIYHLKIESPELFDEWVSKLRHHRLYRQNEMSMHPGENLYCYYPHYPTPGSPKITENASMQKRMSIAKQASAHAPGAGSCNSQAKVAAWLQSSDDMDKFAPMVE
ncbi:hypothetical protein CRUP_004419 [Coryphaenoides rupestris]|nr:hypothetical protein CRUP_004419 [Coryphaenoides rupestris]